MRIMLSIAGAGLLVHGASAAEMELSVELPRLQVAEYHNPYIAIWIAKPDHSVAANLAVWYQQDAGPEGEGETWLKDIRQWWRRIGRTLDMPIDGVSGPTRTPGKHSFKVTEEDLRLKGLAAGDYILNVEAAREVGGRELIRIPFTWKPEEPAKEKASGSAELGEITLNLIP